MKRPSTYAMTVAVRNAEKMLAGDDYVLEAIPGIPGNFYVQHRTDPERCYIVKTVPGREYCACPFHQAHGVCKHEVFAHEMLRIQHGEEMAENGYR